MNCELEISESKSQISCCGFRTIIVLVEAPQCESKELINSTSLQIQKQNTIWGQSLQSYCQRLVRQIKFQKKREMD